MQSLVLVLTFVLLLLSMAAAIDPRNDGPTFLIDALKSNEKPSLFARTDRFEDKPAAVESALTDIKRDNRPPFISRQSDM